MTIALVLGGGGSRGIAHVGVLEVLVRENIPVDMVVGTSMGSIIGTMFALGYSPTQIGETMRRVQRNSIIRSLSVKARQNQLIEYLEVYLTGKNFADLHLPVYVMAVDMVTGQEVILDDGPLLPAVLASSAVPGAFPPIHYQGTQLADGGVIDTLATHVAYEKGADKIIAVDVYPPLDNEALWTDPVSDIIGIQMPKNPFKKGPLNETRPPSAAAALWRSARIMTRYLHQLRLQHHPPDVLLQPSVSDYGSLDFKDVDGPRLAGIAEAEQHLPALINLANR